MISYLLKAIIYAFFFLFPLFYLPITSESYEYNKMALLLFVILVSVFLYSLKAVSQKSIIIIKSSFGTLLALLGAIALISTFLQSPNPAVSLATPLSATTLSLAPFLYLLLVYFFHNLEKSGSRSDNTYFLTIFVFNSILLSIFVILLYTGFLPKSQFTPAGNLLSTTMYLSVIAVYLISYLINYFLTRKAEGENSKLKSQNAKLSVRQAQDPEYIEGQLKTQNLEERETKPKVSILETDLIESQILNIPFLNFRTGDTIGGFTLNGFTMKGTPSKGAVRLADEHLMGVNRGRTRKLESGEKLDTEALYNSEKFVSDELHYNKEKSNTTKKISSASKIERQDSQVSIASKLLFPFVFTAIILAPLAYLIQRSSHSSPVYLSGKLWDISHLYYPGLSLFLLSSGPLLLIATFGLPSYFSRVSFSRLLFFLITFFSFIFTLIPITIGQSNILSFLGFHNLRFSTPHSYIFLGIAAVLFLRAILKKPIGIYAVGILVFVYLSLSVSGFWQIHARNPYSAGFLQFLPSKLYQGLKTLENNNVDSAVLASPSSLLGVIIPAISGRRVYIGRSIFTQHLAKKTATATKFYALQMAPDEAKNFLGKEKIDSILLTQTDTGKKEFLEHYKFLRILYENNQLTILKLY